jgi:hypothetical protein
VYGLGRTEAGFYKRVPGRARGVRKNGASYIGTLVLRLFPGQTLDVPGAAGSEGTPMSTG